MLCCGLLTLILSWASVAVDTAAAVVSGDREGRGGGSCAGAELRGEGTGAILPSPENITPVLTGHQRLLRGPGHVHHEPDGERHQRG